MEIKHTNNEKNGVFEAIKFNAVAGEMSYVWAGDKKFIIDHTEVSEAYAGQGIGKQLLLATVAYARENDLKIIPLCPYAKSVFDKDESLRDVL